eukprot:scaffold26209_cov53-Phaeocystis_antarctica.AAC.1
MDCLDRGRRCRPAAHQRGNHCRSQSAAAGNPGPVRRCSPRTHETNTAFALNRQSAPAFIGDAELNFAWVAEGRNNKTNT